MATDLRRELSRPFSAAALTLAGSESRLSTAPLLAPAGISGWALAGESRASLRAIAVVAGVTIAAVAMRLRALVTAEVTIAAALSDCELRNPPFLFLSFDARQLSPDQGAVNRAFLDVGSSVVVIGMILMVFNRMRLFLPIESRLGHRLSRRRGNCRLLDFDNCRGFGRFYIRRGSDMRSFDVRLGGKNFFVESGGRFFLTPLGKLAAFVSVLGVARCAASLFDVFLDHRDDGVVREPPLARTIVVQYVTETQPALLHSVSPENNRVMAGRETRWRSFQSSREGFGRATTAAANLQIQGVCGVFSAFAWSIHASAACMVRSRPASRSPRSSGTGSSGITPLPSSRVPVAVTKSPYA
jgi:hypothetical protein